MIDPNDIDSLTESMLKILTDHELREEMSRKSLERAEMFSWKKTAKETWNVYEDALIN